MSNSVSSYRKTILASLAAAVVCGLTLAGAVIFLHGSLAAILESGAAFGTVLAASVVASGLVILRRERRAERHEPDLFLELNRSRTADAVATVSSRARGLRRLLARPMLGHGLLVGDEVEVASLEEIRATLDSRGMLESLPFMPEMEKFCGSRARVFRCLDKIYDYGRTKQMRQLDGCVLLVGLRCSGAAHGGCQAACFTIWKTRWLKRVDSRSAPATQVAERESSRAAAVPLHAGRFVCQFTQLQAASRPFRPWDVRRELRPLIAGNVTLRAFLLATATRWFNVVQSWRGGQAFPGLLPAPDQPTFAAPPLESGDIVTVRPKDDIARTLDRQCRNRGLWFDTDMLKHCGRTYRVGGRIERIIDAATGRLLEMKSPCIVLDGVECSGEFQAFGPQHEFLYWRETWLEKGVAAHAHTGDRPGA